MNVSIYTKMEMIMEPTLLKNSFCNWGLSIHWSVFHFELNTSNKDNADMIIQNNFLLEYENKRTTKRFFGKGGYIMSSKIFEHFLWKKFPNWSVTQINHADFIQS